MLRCTSPFCRPINGTTSLGVLVFLTFASNRQNGIKRSSSRCGSRSPRSGVHISHSKYGQKIQYYANVADVASSTSSPPPLEFSTIWKDTSKKFQNMRKSTNVCKGTRWWYDILLLALSDDLSRPKQNLSANFEPSKKIPKCRLLSHFYHFMQKTSAEVDARISSHHHHQRHHPWHRHQSWSAFELCSMADKSTPVLMFRGLGDDILPLLSLLTCFCYFYLCKKEKATLIINILHASIDTRRFRCKHLRSFSMSNNQPEVGRRCWKGKA